MKILACILAALIGAWFCGCASQPTQQTQLTTAVGRRVTLEGVAEARKLGAALHGDEIDVWIDRLQDWPRDYEGQRVRVTGFLDERYDLPVFVQKPGEPVVAGIPVVEGTDLREASRRYIVREATWSLIR